MEKKTFELKYGKSKICFDLPEESLLCELVGANQPAIEDLQKAYKHCLDHPIDSPPLSEKLKPNDKVVIAVSDITRAWQRSNKTLPILLEYLNKAGITDEQITIIIAVGGHRKNTEEEFKALCSEDVFKRVKIINHNPEAEDVVYLGKTSRGTEVRMNRLAMEADKLILTGGVIYHYMAGYGGGRKSILPGIASLDTISQNHLHGLSDTVGGGSNPLIATGLTRGNPLHEDMMEIADFVQPDFLVNVVPNLDGDIAGIFAGNWVSAWFEACKMVDAMFGVPIEEQADIVIATAGGYPKDINLYQSQKTIDNASYAMKPGGVSIILAECPLIGDPPEFFEWFEYPDLLSLETAARKNFLITGWLAVKQLEYEKMGTIILVTPEKNFELARKAHVEPVYCIEDALDLAYQKCGVKDPKFIVMPQGANTFPIKQF
ncbi:nickel-dependent lactate racemase [Dethiosulfatarculus sandiegensis]|uniref:Uncharacterized protein n=1 Tax=Dethiosulfatarculus sandiegensis TaxID=1429043 RepID=A0A0D2J6J9_9BACT|nr:nickel-dependent lactate racemase [Dethiosulfatarculus sandiegensis]KIX13784.1 hypothetical protein X474_12900 [Dethiosulfatarculus sandiegensis]